MILYGRTVRKFLTVSPKHPCPICEKKDWCGYSDDGHLVICMRVQSDRPAKNGGWTHIIKDFDTQLPILPPPPPTMLKKVGVNIKKTKDFGGYHKSLYAKWSPAVPMWLGETLGVAPSAVERLGCVPDFSAKGWAWPMRDGDGKIIGIRYRNNDGKKWAAKDSKNGLFYPEDIAKTKRLVICEGPTDTAAAMTIGLNAVGRFSCSGGADMLNVLIRRLWVTEVVIVSDNDGEKQTPQGRVFEPGLDGALRLAKDLSVRCKVVLMPSKDIRKWVGEGNTLAQWQLLEDNAIWRNPVEIAKTIVSEAIIKAETNRTKWTRVQQKAEKVKMPLPDLNDAELSILNEAIKAFDGQVVLELDADENRQLDQLEAEMERDNEARKHAGTPTSDVHRENGTGGQNEATYYGQTNVAAAGRTGKKAKETGTARTQQDREALQPDLLGGAGTLRGDYVSLGRR